MRLFFTLFLVGFNCSLLFSQDHRKAIVTMEMKAGDIFKASIMEWDGVDYQLTESFQSFGRVDALPNNEMIITLPQSGTKYRITDVRNDEATELGAPVFITGSPGGPTKYETSLFWWGFVF